MIYDNDHKYDDIINLPHHVSKIHIQMPVGNRAAQFAPFAALTGHGEAIRETARLTEDKIEPDEYEREILDRKLSVLRKHIGEKCVIRITHFQPDMKKQGGKYIMTVGSVKRIDEFRKCIVMADGTEILTDNILDISGDVYKNFF